MVGIGVIGFGYWGPNLVRNFCQLDEARVVAVCDQDPVKRQLAQKSYPHIETLASADDLINHPDVDAVVIATPVSSHHALGLQTLRAGKHALIEKPLARSGVEAQELVDEAEKRNLVLLVDHTFIYTGAVQFIDNMLKRGEIGEFLYYDSSRINLGLFQHDVDVIWDLAVHDLSIIGYLFDEKPIEVSATGASHVLNGIENTAFITLFFGSGAIAHINVNWMSPVKLRRTILGGSDKMIVYDDLEPDAKIKVFDKGVTVTNDEAQVYEMLVGYRAGDILIPKVENTEALKVEAAHFIDCIANGTKPVTDGNFGLDVVRISEAATNSMKMRGKPVPLRY